MGKSIKYKSYEDWVCGRIARSRSKMIATKTLLKVPKYIHDLEIEPTVEDLERRLVALRDRGRIAALNKRWYLLGPGAVPLNE